MSKIEAIASATRRLGMAAALEAAAFEGHRRWEISQISGHRRKFRPVSSQLVGMAGSQDEVVAIAIVGAADLQSNRQTSGGAAAGDDGAHEGAEALEDLTSVRSRGRCG